MQDEELSPDELRLLEEAMKSYGAPQQDEKHNIHTFLNNVTKSPDTTKTGNLAGEEVGITPYSLRTYKQIAVACSELVNDDIWFEYFRKKGEILTSTSLSKDAKLISLAVLQRRENLLGEMNPKPQKPNKGWFKSKKNSGDNVE